MSRSIDALRSANPRRKADFEPMIHTAAHAVRARIAPTSANVPTRTPQRPSPRRRYVRASVGAVSVAAATALVALFMIASPATGPGVEDAVAAVRKAATVSAAEADASGTVVVRITHNGEVWAGVTIGWHGEDLSLSGGEPQRRGRRGSEFRVVNGSMYVVEDGEWVNIGSPESIDPDSGTTPAEYLAAVREDIGGATLRRITGGMTGLTTSQLDDGSTVYGGSVAAGLIAREAGFKEGQGIRVFPFGYVAHDEAANPDSLLDAAVTVGADGIVREITVTWGTWMYSVGYSRLGETPAPVAPENARDLLRERLSAG